MIKKTVLAFAIVPLLGISQNIKYSFSDEFETVKKHRDMGFYKFGKNDYCEVYYREGDDMLFQLFDGDFKNMKKQETVLLPENSKKFDNEGFFSVKDNYYWFYSTWERKTETERLFALPFNKQTLGFATSDIKMIETGRLYPYNKYQFNYSADSSKMLVTYRVKPKERRDKLNKDIIGFNLYDANIKKLYSAEIEMPYSEADMNNLDYEIDSNGNIYMLTSVKINNSIDGEVDKDNKNAMRYELMRVNQKENTMQALRIDLENGKFSNIVSLQEDLKHDIVITGYYSNKKYSSGADGAYIIRLEYDANNSVKGLKKTYCEFPTEVLKAYENERTKRKMEKKDKDNELEAANLDLRKLVYNPDGSIVIIGEEHYVVTHTHYNGKTTTTTYTYFYNDILALKVDKDGKTIWCKKIPKQQSGKGFADLSFHHHQYKNEDYFFYLDNVKNINLALTEKPHEHSSGRGGYLTCVKVDANGTMTKKSIFDIKDEDIKIFPRNFESISENLIVDRLKEDRKTSKIFKLEIK